MSNPHQRKILRFIRENGGYAIPQGGGYWKTANGCLINAPNVTRTIYALEEYGWLERRHFAKEPHRDTYAAVPLTKQEEH